MDTFLINKLFYPFQLHIAFNLGDFVSGMYCYILLTLSVACKMTSTGEKLN